MLAIDDDIIDGGDALVFSPFDERVNSIRGPITIIGGEADTAGLDLNDPVLLPGETNQPNGDGEIDTIATDGTTGVTTITDFDVTHVNGAYGERPGFDPRINEIATIYDIGTIGDTSSSERVDLATVGEDILSFASDTPFSVDLMVGSSDAIDSGKALFFGTPDQSDLGLLDWLRATVDLTGLAVAGEAWTLTLSPTPNSSAGQVSVTVTPTEDQAYLGAVARLLAEAINDQHGAIFTAKATVNLLGETRLHIVENDNSAFDISLTTPTDGDAVIGGTPVVGQYDQIGLGWLLAAIQVLDPLPSGALWGLSIDGSVRTVASDGTAGSITNGLAVRIAGSYQPVVSGSFVTIDAPLPDDFDNTQGARYSYRPVNPNLRVDEAVQVDTLTVFNGESPVADVGVLTDTRLTGLGMGGDAQIGGIVVPGGVTYFALEVIDIRLGRNNDTFTVETTHEGKTRIDSGRGDDDIFIKTTYGHTVVITGEGADEVDVGSDRSVVDQITGLLLIDTGDDSGDTVRIDDSLDGNDNVAVLTGDRLTGLDMPSVAELQLIGIRAVGGSFTVRANVGTESVPVWVVATLPAIDFETADADAILAAEVAAKAAIDAMFGTTDVLVRIVARGAGFAYLVEFGGITGGQDIADLEWADVVEGPRTLLTLELTGTPALGETWSILIDGQTAAAPVSVAGDLTALATALAAAIDGLAGFASTAAGAVVTAARDDALAFTADGFAITSDGGGAIGDGAAIYRSQLVAAADSTVDVTVTEQRKGTLEPGLNTVQAIDISATGGSFTLSFVVPNVLGIEQLFTTIPIAFDATAEAILAALDPILNPNNAFPFLPFTKNMAVERFGDVVYLTFQGEHAGLTIEAIDTSGLTGTVLEAEIFFADPTSAEIWEIEVTDLATALIDAAIPGDAAEFLFSYTAQPGDTAATVAAAFAAMINDAQGPHLVATAADGVLVIVSRSGERVSITVSGPLAAPIQTDLAVVDTRVDGIAYYDVEYLEIDLGSGNDVFNVQGTTAHTTARLGAGDERVYVSSDAGFDLTTSTLFLTGHLHRIEGMLNIEAGDGRHLLMISDEASVIGDGDAATDRALITDTRTHALDTANAIGADNRLSSENEIFIVGLAPAPITYGADGSGNFFDGITYWTGFGNDDIEIDGTHLRGVVGQRTVTSLNTGLGDDDILVDLDTPNDDGFFVLNTQGPYDQYLEFTDADTVDASASTLPLVIFGGQDDDDITSGQADDIVFADRGRVEYLDDAAGLGLLLGSGGPEDVTDGVERAPTRIHTIDPLIGGADVVASLGGNDIVLGGINGDRIDAGDGNNIVIGDSGEIDYVTDDDDRSDIDRIHTTDPDDGGSDIITTGQGDDIVLAGEDGETVIDTDLADTRSRGRAVAPGTVTLIDPETGLPVDGDVIDAGQGRNLVFGDNGAIVSASDTQEQGAASFGGQPIVLGFVETTDEAIGGDDAITTGIGADIILGGIGNDRIVAKDLEVYVRGSDAASHDANNIILGDNGLIDWVGTDDDARDIDLIATTDPTLGGADVIVTGAGNDLIIGGTAGDEIFAGAGNDLVFGDHGEMRTAGPGGAVDATLLPLSTAETLASFAFTAIFIETADLGGADLIVGEDGEDVILGQQGGDVIYGGNGDDDIIGGHNVPGGQDGADRIDGSGHVLATLDPLDNPNPRLVLSDQSFDPTSSDNDVIVGDNGLILRRDDSVSLRFRTLQSGETEIYERETNTLIDPLDDSHADGVAQSNPAGVAARDIVIFDHTDANDANPASGLYGDDYIAGGPDDDVIFGQLGDDVIQGDGWAAFHGVESAAYDPLRDAFAARADDGSLRVIPTAGHVRDGDDYIEANGGSDVVFGGKGQDDILGGSSDLYIHDGSADPRSTNGDETSRPDAGDFLFGGTGAPEDLSRNNLGDGIAGNGHALDADTILGDNGRILRLVEVVGLATGFLGFNYDLLDPARGGYGTPTTGENFSDRWVVVRAAELLDYTPGGPDFRPDLGIDPASFPDNGAGDEIHGEAGDDAVYGMTGDDILFGEAQDDDLIGGWGSDWISAGAGEDGVIGDDGRIWTSRNSDAYGEPLFGIGPVAETTISTPGKIQEAVINIAGELKKAVNLTPFNLTPDADSADDPLNDPEYADDIIYGGLGDDFLHGGAGDDLISGAEALPEAYFNDFGQDVENPDETRIGAKTRSDYTVPFNPGNALAYNALYAGEFAAYDEFNPRDKILIGGDEFFGNFLTDDLNALAVGTLVNDPTDDVFSDGNDFIFGDLGNDWLIGGTGQDHIWGGWGNDLLNADDDHEREAAASPDGANDTPDTHPTYQDIAYGGAGRDVLIGNTGGDRLIDWAGEFNSYIVPFAPFGAFAISRALLPQMQEYLYDLSESDGADPTRSIDTNAPAERNGEPEGEIGLVTQQDLAWQDQTGAPDDVQPGNIPGGARDVLQSADFNGNASTTTRGFAADSGNFVVTNGAYEISPDYLGGDAVSVFYVDHVLPSYFEVRATINGGKPTGGLKSNAYLIFDYQSPTDFKFAGVNISTDKFEMGIRTEAGWIVLEQTPVKARPNRDYALLLALNGSVATLVIDGQDFFTHVFDPRVDIYGVSHGLNDGMVGIGAQNSITRIDNIAVQILPPEFTLREVETFEDGLADRFDATTAEGWTVAAGVYTGAPLFGAGNALSITDLEIGETYLARIGAEVQTTTAAGIVFDRYSDGRFKFAVIDAENDRVLIGHQTNRGGWVVDASAAFAIDAAQSHALEITLKGTTVSLVVDGNTILGHAFNAPVVDGDIGLIAHGGAATFDNVLLETNDPAYFDPDAPIDDGDGGSGGNDPTVYGYLSTNPVSIADRRTTVATLDVTDAFTIGDLNVTLTITHQRLSDLSVTLIAPSGERITLFAAIGGSGDGLDGAVFDDEAGLSIDSASAPYDVVYRPSGDLSALEGLDAQGTWSLEIVDSVKRNSGTLDSWSLTFTEGAALKATTPGDAEDAAALDQTTLDQAVAQAIDELASELSLTDAEVTLLSSIHFEIADLGGETLGLQSGDTVIIDINAAGHGWDTSSVDGSTSGSEVALSTEGGIDLLTVVKHELGHVLGLDHDDAEEFEWMAPSVDVTAGAGTVALSGAVQGDPGGPARNQKPGRAGNRGE